jgi:hypothetical protein
MTCWQSHVQAMNRAMPVSMALLRLRYAKRVFQALQKADFEA